MVNITKDKDGNPQIDMANIKSIGITNIVDVISHRIMRDGNNTTHDIELKNDGHVHLSYSQKGKIVKFTNTHVSVAINENDKSIFIMRHPNE